MQIITGKHFIKSLSESELLADLPNVTSILDEVRDRGDIALRKYSLEFDNVDPELLQISKEEVKNAYSLVDEELIGFIKKSVDRIRQFSQQQLESFRDFTYEVEQGVVTGQSIIPIERIGAYVPGGRFPLISSVFMGVIPAKIAGVSEVIVCSPPTYSRSLHPAILVSADISGVDEIYRVGGVQAIGAMAYGTETIKKVHKIVGPGNKYVTAAKKAVYGTVGIDFLAGPTEIVIIADETANPEYIAADIIGQAEHDEDAGPILITTSEELSKLVVEELEKQLADVTTAQIAQRSIEKNGNIVLVGSLEEAVELANLHAPEHLEIHTKYNETIVPKLKSYGSLFIGTYAAEALGDYSSGLNHILPTNFAARYTGGLSVKDFIKIQTTLKVSEEGLRAIGPDAYALAKAEGLDGHAHSVAVRLGK